MDTGLGDTDSGYANVGHADLGSFLRQLRRSRHISLEAAAQQAGISRVTLNRWETGQYQPRLPEMEAALRALEATGEQRRQALALLYAPRAVNQLRQEIAKETHSDKVTVSGPGALLRALRLRQRLTVESAAQRLSLNKSVLTRWERGEAWPTPERLHALVSVLGASPEERAALTGGQDAFRFDETLTVESAQEEIRRISLLPPHDPAEPLKDLLFLSLEAKVFPRISQPGYAALLPEIHAAYANYLSGTGRYAEALVRADRALKRVRPAPGSDWWMYAALAGARCDVFRGKRPAPGRGLEVLRAWLPELRQPTFRAWALGDMAQYALMAGDREAALGLSVQSCQVVEATEPGDEIFLRRCDHALLLLTAGLPCQALKAVPTETGDAAEDSAGVAQYPAHRVRVSLIQARAFFALGSAHTAQDFLQRVYGILGAEYLCPRQQSRFREQADALAKQL